MKLTSIDISGKAGKEIDSALFDNAGSTTLVAQAVRVYLANQRAGTAKTKTRAEVNLTKKKWFKQKGTGNARHGAQSAPIFVGGGVAHGQQGNSNWKLSMSQSMRRRALETVLSLQAQAGKVKISSGWSDISGKTKEAVNALSALEVANKAVLLVTGVYTEEMDKATRNIGNLFVCQAKDLTAYYVARAQQVLITPEALEILEKKFEKREKETKPKAEVKKAPAKKVAAKKKPVSAN